MRSPDSNRPGLHVVGRPGRTNPSLAPLCAAVLAWTFEHTVALGTDVREPRFLSFQGKLQLLFFQAGTNPAAFEPQRMLRVRMKAPGQWGEVETVVDSPEVLWRVKVRNGTAWMTSYTGEHYAAGQSKLRVHFKQSGDGDTWSLVDEAPFVYEGGVSEVAFEFDAQGNLWAVTRNEDGDETGFGSHVCFAAAGALGTWDCSADSDPERYDSPDMFRFGDEIYVAARRDVGGPYDEGLSDLPFEEQKSHYLLDYSLRPKRSALYRIDREARKVVFLVEIPGVGDTAFPSVRRSGPNTFVLANYTSPLDKPDISWLEGQVNPEGTSIYLLKLEFE